MNSLDRFDAYLRGLHPGSRPFWIAAAVPALAFALFLGSVGLPTLWRLADRGVRVDGTVVGTPCAGGRRRFAYRFDASGGTVEGLGSTTELGRDCSALVAGTVVPVYYLPTEPSVSAATPDPRLSLGRRALIIAGFGVAALIGFAGVLVVFHRQDRDMGGSGTR